MIEEYENRKRGQISQMRALLDYGMGALFLLVGLYFMLYEILDINIFRSKPSGTDKLIGVLFIIYGSWRIYRGYRKNYFR